MAEKYNHRRDEEEFKKMKKRMKSSYEKMVCLKLKFLLCVLLIVSLLIRIEDFMKELILIVKKIIAAARQTEEHSLSEPKNVKDFIDSLASIALLDSLKAFGFETQLIAFFLYRGYKAKEISVLTGIPEWTISRRISELIKTYKFFKSNT